jgi:CRISPR-associated exonuclease Cas4
MIKQYHYCPRVVYFQMVQGVKERTTAYMEEGKEAQEKEEFKDRRRKTLFAERKMEVLESWHNLHLISEKLGMEGVVDLLVRTPDGYIVVERKNARLRGRPPPSHVYQAVAYAMLVEENMGVIVRKIVLRYVNAAHEITLTEQMRRHVVWTLNQIRKIVEKEILPPFRRRKQCPSCGYRWICLEV